MAYLGKYSLIACNQCPANSHAVVIEVASRVQSRSVFATNVACCSSGNIDGYAYKSPLGGKANLIIHIQSSTSRGRSRHLSVLVSSNCCAYHSAHWGARCITWGFMVLYHTAKQPSLPSQQRTTTKGKRKLCRYTSRPSPGSSLADSPTPPHALD